MQHCILIHYFSITRLYFGTLYYASMLVFCNTAICKLLFWNIKLCKMALWQRIRMWIVCHQSRQRRQVLIDPWRTFAFFQLQSWVISAKFILCIFGSTIKTKTNTFSVCTQRYVNPWIILFGWSPSKLSTNSRTKMWPSACWVRKKKKVFKKDGSASAFVAKLPNFRIVVASKSFAAELAIKIWL